MSFSVQLRDDDELRGVKGELKKRSQELRLWAQREPAIHTRYAKAKTGGREMCVQNIRCGGLVLLISGCLQDLCDREGYAGSTDMKCSARSMTKSRKNVYCQRPGKAGGNKIVKILQDFFQVLLLRRHIQEEQIWWL